LASFAEPVFQSDVHQSYLSWIYLSVFYSVAHNRLPASIVSAENIHLFKKLLRQVDFSYAVLGKD